MIAKSIINKFTAAAAAVLMILSVPAVCFADQDPLESDEYYNPVTRRSDSDDMTVDTLTLYSSDGAYVFSGKDASADGTVTLTAGNTYNFSLDLTDTAYNYMYPTGIYLRYDYSRALFYPLNDEDAYLYRFRLWKEGDHNLGDPSGGTSVVSEHVDFIDVSLNESISTEVQNTWIESDVPGFGLSGKVVITYTVRSGDGALTDSVESYSYYYDDSVLGSDSVITYTITIEGDSCGIYTAYRNTTESGTNYYSTGVCYKPGSWTSVYDLEIDENGNKATYDLLDSKNDHWKTDADICFYISDEYGTAPFTAGGADVSGNNDGTTVAANHSSDSLAHKLMTAAKALAVTAAAGAAALAVQGLSSFVGGADVRRDETEVSAGDSEEYELSVNSRYSDYISTGKNAVTMDLSVTGGTGNEDWKYIAKCLTPGADEIFRTTVADGKLVIGFRNEPEKPYKASLIVTAYAIHNGQIAKASAGVEFTVHSKGIEAAVSEDGKLAVALWNEGNVSGVPATRILGEDEYDIEETDSGKTIRMKAHPEYTCAFPQ